MTAQIGGWYNANQGVFARRPHLNSAGKIVASYWLEHVYTPRSVRHTAKRLPHSHDLDCAISPDTPRAGPQAPHPGGFNGVGGAIASAPAQHFSSTCGQIVASTRHPPERSGQARSALLLRHRYALAPSCAWTTWSTEIVRMHAGLISAKLGHSTRWASQCPFTNLTFDLPL